HVRPERAAAMSSRRKRRIGRMVLTSVTAEALAAAKNSTSMDTVGVGRAKLGGRMLGRILVNTAAIPTPHIAPVKQGSAASAITNAVTPVSEKPSVLRVANSDSRSRTDLAITLALKNRIMPSPASEILRVIALTSTP